MCVCFIAVLYGKSVYLICLMLCYVYSGAVKAYGRLSKPVSMYVFVYLYVPHVWCGVSVCLCVCVSVCVFSVM